jgi:hypothetical protein
VERNAPSSPVRSAYATRTLRTGPSTTASSAVPNWPESGASPPSGEEESRVESRCAAFSRSQAGRHAHGGTPLWPCLGGNSHAHAEVPPWAWHTGRACLDRTSAILGVLFLLCVYSFRSTPASAICPLLSATGIVPAVSAPSVGFLEDPCRATTRLIPDPGTGTLRALVRRVLFDLIECNTCTVRAAESFLRKAILDG